MLRNKRKTILILIFALAIFLRLYKLDVVPVSLFGDELDVAYQSYSLLKTGSDYYGNFLPFHLHSLAEWRTPLYLYSTVPTVALFGISPLGVRLPAAIFGILSVIVFYLLVRELRIRYSPNNSNLDLIATFVLTISPWHIQYSRAAFEVTMMLLFLYFALLFFFKGLNQNRYLYLSAISFAILPWIYSTAKLFTPMFIVALGIVFFKDVIKVPKKNLLISTVLFTIFSLPVIYSILAGGGSQRFGYISVFTDPTIPHEVGTARDLDLFSNASMSRLFHNKFVMWSAAIGNNYLKAFSTEFLFVKGDLNLRHSINNVGLFYKIEALAMLLGVIVFFKAKKIKPLQYFVAFWILGGVVPSAITRDGGNHATRLIIVLAPLVFFVAVGISALSSYKNRFVGFLLVGGYLIILGSLFFHYQHQYWVHNPLNSERWWHYGWQESVETIREIEGNYDKIIISSADEPPWVFFAAWYNYPPKEWHSHFPLKQENKVYLEGFGDVSHIGKFYFGSPQNTEVYAYGQVLNKRMLYLASAKEVGPNLIMEPERTPPDLTLVKAVAFPSGEPAFYLFSGK